MDDTGYKTMKCEPIMAFNLTTGLHFSMLSKMVTYCNELHSG